MADTPIWDVVLYVDGPISVRNKVLTTQQKGFRVEDPFYSEIKIESLPSGLKATVTARASQEEIAYKAAVYFFGHMIDALTLVINQPLRLSYYQHVRHHAPRHDVKRRIEKGEIEDAFHEAHILGRGSPSFLRSLGWYRKGLTAEDPLDRFLAFWNAIEIVASKFYRYVPGIDIERAKKGSKNQVWACFEALWGQIEDWPVIPAQKKWIDESYEIRKDVAHGIAVIDVHKVGDVADRLDAIEKVCFNFLTGWRTRFLDLDRNPPSETLPPVNQELFPG